MPPCSTGTYAKTAIVYVGEEPAAFAIYFSAIHPFRITWSLSGRYISSVLFAGSASVKNYSLFSRDAPASMVVPHGGP